MKAIFLKTLVVAVGVLFFSCGGSDDPSPSNVDVSFLKVGTKYTYYYDDGFWNIDSIYLEVSKQLAPDTFLIRYESESIALSPTQYWVLKDNNLYTSLRLRDPDAYTLECKFGKPKGTTWKTKRRNVEYTYKIEEVNASVKTKDGVVDDAVKVKVSSGAQSGYLYFSPTVGMLGNGSYDDETVTQKPVHYKIGTTNTTTNTIPPISFGNFPFLAVGKYWNYTQEDFFGDVVSLQIKVEEKLASKNIFKVKTTYDGEVDYSYWYEDNGFLMVYDEGENVLNADPIYVDESIAEIGYGWGGLTPSGTLFIYTIDAKNEVVDSYYGELSCLNIGVTDGFISTQSNYWTKAKGNVKVTGMVAREIEATNVRSRGERKIFSVVPSI